MHLELGSWFVPNETNLGHLSICGPHFDQFIVACGLWESNVEREQYTYDVNPW